jgi:ethanolamine utilization protein EutN
VRIGEVIGKVTLSVADKKLIGGRLLIVEPYDPEVLPTGAPSKAEPVVVYDELGAGLGQTVGVSEGREAAMPFHPDPVAIDCYLACMLDEITYEGIEK